MRTLGLIVFLFLIGICASEDEPRVTTELGKIKGYYLHSHGGNKYEAYEGIPYALPPTGTRRFQPPVPVNYLPGELLATNRSNSCLQRTRSPDKNGSYVIGDEDCLYLNVYAPTRKNNETFPVIFWIHGGAFQYGAGTRFGPKFLMDYNVILVTINYRLGVLGFLSTENNVVPGNMGLKDQNLALKWVHAHIKSFGGDPTKVTLTGLSAGGASVHYHYLSPMSKGLFHSGISFSGTAFNSWTQNERSLEKANKLAQIVSCPTDDVQGMVLCLRSRPGKALVNAEAEFMPWRLNPFTPFGPVVERYSENPFINRTPIEIIRSGQVQDLPWITGVVSEEGLYPVAEFALKNEVLKELNENWESIAPQLLDYYYTIPIYYHAEVARAIRHHYFGNKTINRENLSILTHLVGDRLFAADAEKAAKVQAQTNKSPVWFYHYNYRASQSVSDGMTNSTENLGVCHGDDINLVLENHHIEPTKTKTDFAMHKDLIKLWVTVARKGQPTFGPKWSKVEGSKSYLNYLHIIGPGNYTQKSDSNFAQRLFWESIDFDENREIIKAYNGAASQDWATVYSLLATSALALINIGTLFM